MEGEEGDGEEEPDEEEGLWEGGLARMGGRGCVCVSVVGLCVCGGGGLWGEGTYRAVADEPEERGEGDGQGGPVPKVAGHPHAFALVSHRWLCGSCGMRT